MLRIHAVACALMLGLSGCVTSNQKAEVRTGYAIYDMKANPLTDARLVYTALKEGLEKSGTEFSVSIDPPPSPLPEQPGRFKTFNPLRNSNLHALMGAQANTFKTVDCEGASFVATLKNNQFNKYGEDTSFVTCAFPYSHGFSINIWHRYSVNNSNLGASLARSVLGDSSQFIPRTVESVISGLRDAGYDPAIVESF